jgi:hypothetical protein
MLMLVAKGLMVVENRLSGSVDMMLTEKEVMMPAKESGK